jgi:hypothetical protein
MKTKEEILNKVLDRPLFAKGTNLSDETILEIMEEYAVEQKKEANEFIIEIAKLLDMDTDDLGYDELTLSIKDLIANETL